MLWKRSLGVAQTSTTAVHVVVSTSGRDGGEVDERDLLRCQGTDFRNNNKKTRKIEMSMAPCHEANGKERRDDSTY